MKRLVVLLALFLAMPTLVQADFQDGYRAYNEGDYATALREWKPLAEQGDALAQFNLALMYYKGQGVPHDYAEAVKWYRLAAEQGYALAQLNLGVIYAKGQGVPQDYVQAHKWFNLSAAAGNSQATKNRDTVARWMTPSQIAEAQSLAKSGKVGKRVTGWDNLSSDDVKALQRALNAAGYDAGPADGVRGRRTEAALEAYQRHKGLQIGEPKLETLKALGLR